MPEKQEVVVVIGNGMIGQRFLEKMVKYDTDKKFKLITIGEEPRAHYNRMLLTEYFDHRDADKLLLTSSEWYNENGVDLHVGEHVKKINILDKKIVSSSGNLDHVEYDHLVLAIGSKAFVPPIPGYDKTGVFVYRTIEDLNDIISYASENIIAKLSKKRTVVFGGGLLGLEAAKALRDLGLQVIIVERNNRLMKRQLDERGAELLKDKIIAMGLEVILNAETKCIVGENRVEAIHFQNEAENLFDIGLVVFAAGIRCRDDLAKISGIKLGEWGGIVVDDNLRTDIQDIYAIGECALHNGFPYGLVAPGYEMADVVASNITGRDNEKSFPGADMSTKLKLMGVEVASFGAYDMSTIKEPCEELSYTNPIEGIYKKLIFSKDGKKLFGGMLIGDASDYSRLLILCKSNKNLTDSPSVVLNGKIAESENDLPDDAQICSCNNISKGDICSAIKREELKTLSDVKKCTSAGTGCGGCIPLVKEILEAELLVSGVSIDTSLCEHFSYTRQELFAIIQVNQYKSFFDILNNYGNGGIGCEICKPTIGSILASLFNDHILSDSRSTLQDSNDRFLANIQKTGQFSVIPRIAAGEITPEKLIVLGEVGRKYGLYTKITGGQRVDLFGAEKQDLPAIWSDLVDAGFESGHAYGKALRTVKSCVGSNWCRFGVGDSVGFAVTLENRYKGIRSPHKIKGGVSGCTRECAEAQGKDFGLIGTEKGYNLFVCGNGGMKPQHAVLLASDLSEQEVIKYLDRFIMFYIQNANKLERSARWLNRLDGGIEYLKQVIIYDSLKIAEKLEEQMQKLLNTYECEWKKVVDSPYMQKKYFSQFKNTNSTQKDYEMRPIRGQSNPVGWNTDSNFPKEDSPTTVDDPDVFNVSIKPAAEYTWVCVGETDSFIQNGGGAILYGDSQLAVFNVTQVKNGIESVNWYCTQNMCPHKNAFVLSQGILGDTKDGSFKVACPMHKKSFELSSGKCTSNDPYQLETFDVKEIDGKIFVFLPPADVLDKRLATSKFLPSACSTTSKSTSLNKNFTSGCGGDPSLDW